MASSPISEDIAGTEARFRAVSGEILARVDRYDDNALGRLYGFGWRAPSFPGVRLIRWGVFWLWRVPSIRSPGGWGAQIRGYAADYRGAYLAERAAEAKRECAYALALCLGGALPQDLLMRIWAEAFWR